nr:H-NS family nucleoid-associated regulatory protein [Stenotrophomonas rhizophila]
MSQYGRSFSTKQRAEIVKMLAVDTTKQSGHAKKEVALEYWLPPTGETWIGRGRTPRAFAAWEGTPAYTTWKATHPSEKFPALPG